MVKTALEIRDRALREKVDVAILMDMSGACGSTVPYLGSRFAADKVYQVGPGVAAAVAGVKNWKTFAKKAEVSAKQVEAIGKLLLTKI